MEGSMADNDNAVFHLFTYSLRATTVFDVHTLRVRPGQWDFFFAHHR